MSSDVAAEYMEALAAVLPYAKKEKGEREREREAVGEFNLTPKSSRGALGQSPSPPSLGFLCGPRRLQDG